MYNYVDNGWSKTLLKKTITILLIYSLFFTSSANAATVGGWSLSNAVAQGASTVYDATKNVIINGKDFVKKSTVKITPTASQVSKVLARGGAGYALSVAVEQLLGAVDWVLDPANNQIVYTEQNTINCVNSSDCSAYQNIWKIGSSYYSSPDCSLHLGASGWWGQTGQVQVSDTQVKCTRQDGREIDSFSRVANPNYDPTAEQEQKTLPLDVVAAQVISNAESDTDKRAAAQVATTAAAADVVAEAENDEAKARPIANQAEANAETKPADEAEAEKANEAQGQSKPNEANPEAMDFSLEFPVFCSWAPTICEAAQVVISFPNTLTGWYNDTKTKAEEWAASIAEAWTATKEWAKNEENEEQDNDPPEINTIDIGSLDTGTFQATAGCPAPIQVPVNLGTGGNVEISYEPICQFASKWSFVAPLIGFLSGAMILVGVGRKGEDGEI